MPATRSEEPILVKTFSGVHPVGCYLDTVTVIGDLKVPHPPLLSWGGVLRANSPGRPHKFLERSWRKVSGRPPPYIDIYFDISGHILIDVDRFCILSFLKSGWCLAGAKFLI